MSGARPRRRSGETHVRRTRRRVARSRRRSPSTDGGGKRRRPSSPRGREEHAVSGRPAEGTLALFWRRRATWRWVDSGRSSRLPRTSDGDGSRGRCVTLVFATTAEGDEDGRHCERLRSEAEAHEGIAEKPGRARGLTRICSCATWARSPTSRDGGGMPPRRTRPARRRVEPEKRGQRRGCPRGSRGRRGHWLRRGGAEACNTRSWAAGVGEVKTWSRSSRPGHGQVHRTHPSIAIACVPRHAPA